MILIGAFEYVLSRLRMARIAGKAPGWPGGVIGSWSQSVKSRGLILWRVACRMDNQSK